MTDERTFQKLITEYNPENPNEKRSLAQYLEDRLGEISSITRHVASVESQRRKECDRHEAAIQELNKELSGIQKECPHISTTYHPDASGNNDSYVECNHCGKYAKRLSG